MEALHTIPFYLPIALGYHLTEGETVDWNKAVYDRSVENIKLKGWIKIQYYLGNIGGEHMYPVLLDPGLRTSFGG